MGNKQTSLPIGQYLAGPLPKPSCAELQYIIQINLQHPLDAEQTRQSFVISIRTGSTQLASTFGTLDVVPAAVVASGQMQQWTPNSQMRDFEVIQPFLPDEIRLAKGQVIGVLIVECFAAYIKMYYDKSNDHGVELHYMAWEHNSTAHEVLNNDLVLGLDVLLVQGPDADKIVHLRDLKLAPAAAYEGKVWAPGLSKSLECYKHYDDKPTNNDDVSDDEKCEAVNDDNEESTESIEDIDDDSHINAATAKRQKTSETAATAAVEMSSGFEELQKLEPELEHKHKMEGNGIWMFGNKIWAKTFGDTKIIQIYNDGKMMAEIIPEVEAGFNDCKFVFAKDNILYFTACEFQVQYDPTTKTHEIEYWTGIPLPKYVSKEQWKINEDQVLAQEQQSCIIGDCGFREPQSISLTNKRKLSDAPLLLYFYFSDDGTGRLTLHRTSIAELSLGSITYCKTPPWISEAYKNMKMPEALETRDTNTILNDLATSNDELGLHSIDNDSFKSTMYSRLTDREGQTSGAQRFERCIIAIMRQLK